MYNNILIWQILTWQIFHKITLNYNQEYKDKYIKFFESFKTIIPCSICKNNYNDKINKLNLNNVDDYFQMTINLHNDVNKLHNKRNWKIEEAKNHYKKLNLSKKSIKMFLFSYIHYNFKKGPHKTEQLINMIKSFIYLIPHEKAKKRLIDFNNYFQLNRDNFQKWIYTALLIIQKEM